MNEEMPDQHQRSHGRDAEEKAVNPPIQMWVRPRMDQGQLKWDVGNSPSPASKRKKVILLEDGSGSHQIMFHLHDPDSLGLKFDTANPIYAEDNVTCPPAQALVSDQVPVGGISCNDNRLTITDLNSGKARLVRYQLNFLNADGTKAAACDPVILNGGGGGEDP